MPSLLPFKTSCNYDIHGCIPRLLQNGMEGTRDCRYFAAIYLIARIVLFVASAMTMTPYIFPVASLLLAILAMFTALIQPYKANYAKYNILDPILIFVCSIWFSSVGCVNIAEIQDTRYLMVSFVFSFIVGISPLVYIIGLSLNQMCCQRQVVQRFGQRIKQLYWKRVRRSEMESADLELLPYRMVNTSTYESIWIWSTCLYDCAVIYSSLPVHIHFVVENKWLLQLNNAFLFQLVFICIFFLQQFYKAWICTNKPCIYEVKSWAICMSLYSWSRL